jgi:hypothetical protein
MTPNPGLNPGFGVLDVGPEHQVFCYSDIEITSLLLAPKCAQIENPISFFLSKMSSLLSFYFPVCVAPPPPSFVSSLESVIRAKSGILSQSTMFGLLL